MLQERNFDIDISSRLQDTLNLTNNQPRSSDVFKDSIANYTGE
jgi:hypothetical protein